MVVSFKYDFVVEPGNTWSFELTDFPEDVSNHSFFMQVRKEQDVSSDLIVDLSDYMVVGENSVTVNVPSEVTKGFDFGKAFYDLYMKRVDGVVVKFLEGCVKLGSRVSEVDGS